MIIAYMLLAEGLGSDARNAITAIALNQNILVVPSLPTTTKRAVVTRLEDVGWAVGTTAEVSYSVRSPSGRVMLAQSGGLTVGEALFPEVPQSADLPAEFVLNVTEYGAHTFTVEVRSQGGEQATAELRLYVVPPPELQEALSH